MIDEYSHIPDDPDYREYSNETQFVVFSGCMVFVLAFIGMLIYFFQRAN